MEQFNPKPVAEDIETKVGDLSGLNTTEKTSLVGAVNELSEQIAMLDTYETGNITVPSGITGNRPPLHNMENCVHFRGSSKQCHWL